MRELLSVLAALIGFGAFIPYARDIIRGRAKPSRSTRIMFAALMIIALLQQHDLGSGWTLAVTIGETAGALAILGLAIKRGMGGLNKIDLICYALLSASIIVCLTTKNALLALHMTVIADIVAFWPTLVKTWHHPETETGLFFGLGAVVPILSIFAGGNYAYGIILFPLYLAAINIAEVVLIYRPTLSHGNDILAK